jgi:AcrR family transcriptional regulator
MTTEKDTSTEEKILEAAAELFTHKGFDGTRTRDIAEKANINLALLNYYFRSKEKLFQQVMKLKVVLLFGKIIPIISNEKTSLDEKINLLSEKYFEILIKNPNLPLFVISEIQKQNSEIKTIIPAEKVIKNMVLMKQIKERKPELNPFHFLLSDAAFQAFVEERKKLVPIWIKLILNN